MSIFEHCSCQNIKRNHPPGGYNQNNEVRWYELQGFDPSGRLITRRVHRSMRSINSQLYAQLGLNPKDDVMVIPV